jgi:hypothetical protein
MNLLRGDRDVAGTLFELWVYSAAGLITTHLVVAFIIDRSITLGLWAKGALLLFSLLGPLGAVLEAILLCSVLEEIARQKFSRRVAEKKQSKADTIIELRNMPFS